MTDSPVTKCTTLPTIYFIGDKKSLDVEGIVKPFASHIEALNTPYENGPAPGKIVQSTSNSGRKHHSGFSESLRNCFMKFKSSQLCSAANTNSVHKVRELLALGADPTIGDTHLRTPLHFAATKGNVQVARLLLENKADPNQRDSLGSTPLHLAACTNHVAIVALLLDKGADVKSVDNCGRNPLHLAYSKLILMTGKPGKRSKVIKRDVREIVDLILLCLRNTGDMCNADQLASFISQFNDACIDDEIDIDSMLDKMPNLSLT